MLSCRCVNSAAKAVSDAPTAWTRETTEAGILQPQSFAPLDGTADRILAVVARKFPYDFLFSAAKRSGSLTARREELCRVTQKTQADAM